MSVPSALAFEVNRQLHGLPEDVSFEELRKLPVEQQGMIIAPAMVEMLNRGTMPEGVAFQLGGLLEQQDYVGLVGFLRMMCQKDAERRVAPLFPMEKFPEGVVVDTEAVSPAEMQQAQIHNYASLMRFLGVYP